MGYNLYQSNLIKNNHQVFINDCSVAYKCLKDDLNIKDSTWDFYKYNIFAVTSSSILFYNLYRELNYHIRSYVGNDRPLWMQSWLNYHEEDNTLLTSLGNKKGFHGHGSLYHGYISIDPQNTITKFRNGLEIPNKIGQLYLGPGANSSITPPPEDPWDHYVKALTPFLKPRITIAFDISEYVNHALRSTFIPIL